MLLNHDTLHASIRFEYITDTHYLKIDSIQNNSIIIGIKYDSLIIYDTIALDKSHDIVKYVLVISSRKLVAYYSFNDIIFKI